MLNINRLIRSTRAAIDLASIMVGILVIGIIAGVIAATVFAVIPWAQDNAAKANLDAAQTAQSAAYTYSKDGSYAGPKGYQSFVELVGNKWLSPSNAVFIGTGTDRECFVAVAKSDSGRVFYSSNKDKKAKQYNPGDTVTDCPVNIPDLIDETPPLASGPFNTATFQADEAYSSRPGTAENLTLQVPGVLPLLDTVLVQDTAIPANTPGFDEFGVDLLLDYSQTEAGGALYVGATKVADVTGTITALVFKDATNADNRATRLQLNSVTMTDINNYARLYGGTGSLHVGGNVLPIPASPDLAETLQLTGLNLTLNAGQTNSGSTDPDLIDQNNLTVANGGDFFAVRAVTRNPVSSNNLLSHYNNKIIGENPHAYRAADATYYAERVPGSGNFEQVGAGPVCMGIDEDAKLIVSVNPSSTLCGDAANSISSSVVEGLPAIPLNWRIVVDFRGSQTTFELPNTVVFRT